MNIIFYLFIKVWLWCNLCCI